MEPGGLKYALLTTTDSLLVALERDLVERLYVYSLLPFSLHTTKELKRLPFFPTSLKCHGNLVAIGGDENVGVLNFAADDAFTLIGRPVETVVDFNWHPLTENCLAVLTTSNTLKLYDVSESTDYAEVEIRLNRPTPFRSFTFLPELHGLTLHRFAAVLMTEEGDIYTVSPVVPRKFYVDKAFWGFRQVVSKRVNEYNDVEPSVKDWFLGLDRASNPAQKTFVSVSQDFLHRYAPECIGPVNERADKASFVRIVCLHSSEPCVLALQQDSGELHIYVSFMDIIPAFTLRTATTIFAFKETLTVETRGAGLLRKLSTKVFYYLQGGKLYEITMNWIQDLIDQFRQRRLGSVDLRPTVMQGIEEGLAKVDSFEIVDSSYSEKKAYVSQGSTLRQLIISNTVEAPTIDLSFISVEVASQLPQVNFKVESRPVSPFNLQEDPNPALVLSSQAVGFT
jgi:hypothetical protein